MSTHKKSHAGNAPPLGRSQGASLAAAVSLSSKIGKKGKKRSRGTPLHGRYRPYATEPEEEVRMKPSLLLEKTLQLNKNSVALQGGLSAFDIPQSILEGEVKPEKRMPPPEIIELLNMADNSAQKRSKVPVGLPLFQPSMSVVSFRNFKAFKKCRQTLYLRNSDIYARRILIEKTVSQHFQISRPFLPEDVGEDGNPSRYCDGRVSRKFAQVSKFSDLSSLLQKPRN